MITKQKYRQRFLSEHLELIPFPNNDFQEITPESPKIRLLQLENTFEMEELNLSGNEEIASVKTDFALNFSTTEEEKSQKNGSHRR